MIRQLLVHTGPPLLGIRLSKPPSTKFTKKLLRRREKGVLLEMSPNNHHRVRPHDVDHGIPAELREMVGTDNGIVVSAPNIVHTRFKLDHILETMRLRGNPSALLAKAAISSNAASIRS